MGEYRPGDTITAEIEFQHKQIVHRVSVVYRHSLLASAPPMTLSDEAWVLSEEPWVGEELSGRVISSGAAPTAVVGLDHELGTYQLSEIVFETFSGNRITLAVVGESLQQLSLDTRAFTIMEEPDDPPVVRNLHIN
jgi:hypothetical protein